MEAWRWDSLAGGGGSKTVGSEGAGSWTGGPGSVSGTVWLWLLVRGACGVGAGSEGGGEGSVMGGGGEGLEDDGGEGSVGSG